MLTYTTGAPADYFRDLNCLKAKDLAASDLEARGRRESRPGRARCGLRELDSASSRMRRIVLREELRDAPGARARARSRPARRGRAARAARAADRGPPSGRSSTRPPPAQAGQARVSTRSRLPRERCRVISIRPNSEIGRIARPRAVAARAPPRSASKSVAAVLGVLHVDEVHDEQTAEVPQPDLPGDLREPPRGSPRRPSPRGPPCRRTGPC